MSEKGKKGWMFQGVFYIRPCDQGSRGKGRGGKGNCWQTGVKKTSEPCTKKEDSSRCSQDHSRTTEPWELRKVLEAPMREEKKFGIEFRRSYSAAR